MGMGRWLYIERSDGMIHVWMGRRGVHACLRRGALPHHLSFDRVESY